MGEIPDMMKKQLENKLENDYCQEGVVWKWQEMGYRHRGGWLWPDRGDNGYVSN